MRPKIRASRFLRVVTVLLLLITTGSRAQTPPSGKVSGLVRDSGDRTPLPGVSIAFGPGQVTTSTSDSGRFSVALPVGSYQVVFRFTGYADQTIPVLVDSGKTFRCDVMMRSDVTQLDMVVVSAGKFEQRVGEVTQSLSVLPASIIRDKNVSSLDKGLDQVPGVVIMDDDPQIRAGSGFSYGAGSRVMLLIDGLPILSGDIGRPNWTFIPIESVEQVEVIKGASSVLYGSAALSGVINVRTAFPGSTPTTRASLFGGCYGAPGHAPAKWWDNSPPIFTGANFTHSEQFGPFDLTIGGNVFADQGFIGPERIAPDTLAKDPYRTDDGGYENRARFNIATRWRNRKVPGLTYGLNGNFMKSRSTSVFIWDNIDEGLYRPYPGTITHTNGTQAYLDPFVEYHGPNGMKQSFKGRWYRQDFVNDNAQSNANDMLYGEYQAQRKLQWMGETTITAGLVAQEVFSHAVLYSGGGDGSGDNTATNLAGYLQVDKKVIDRLMVNAGVRYERFQVNDDRQAEPVLRAGATYQLFKATFLRASFGQGFRFPTIGERYILTSVGQLNIYPNPGLEPETSVNVEVGAKQGFRIGGFTGYLDAVVFRQDLDRYVEFTFGQWGSDLSLANLFGLGFTSLNTGGARITGAEFEVVGKGNIGKVGIGLLMGYTYTLPVSTTPDEVYGSYTTPLGLDQDVTYMSTSSDPTNEILKFRVAELFRSDIELTWERFDIGVSVRYNSNVQNIDNAFIFIDRPGILPMGVTQWMADHTTGDAITDLRVGFALTPQLKASFIVNNASNEVYAIRPMSIEAPRSFQVQLAFER